MRTDMARIPGPGQQAQRKRFKKMHKTTMNRRFMLACLMHDLMPVDCPHWPTSAPFEKLIRNGEVIRMRLGGMSNKRTSFMTLTPKGWAACKRLKLKPYNFRQMSSEVWSF